LVGSVQPLKRVRIAFLSPGYPSADTPYDWAFVHARAKLYRGQGHAVAAFTLGPERRWSFEAIDAERATPRVLLRSIHRWKADVIALHGPYFRLIHLVRTLGLPYVVWVHGHEALWHWGGFRHGATRRDRLLRAIKTPGRLAWQMWNVRRFLSGSAHVVFVSDWMRRAAERHTQRRFRGASIIPNPVDTSQFGYVWDPRNLTQGVTARSLSSRKYGVDIAIRAIAQSRTAQLSIIGTGSLEPSLRHLARRLTAPVTFSGSFVPHAQLPRVYANYGFFVAASRVEAQGVAMCEAMACGLPVIATNVGGIPEFVRHDRNGYLSARNDPSALADGIRRLTGDVARATQMSEMARVMIETTCGHQVVTQRELAALRSASSVA
jgi:glycosyltransferase involved in cell wall biosynthesis